MALEGGHSGRAVSEWSDKELQTVLASYGDTQVPVTPTTRPMLERRVERMLFSKSSDAESSMGKDRAGKNDSSPQRDRISPALPAKGKENDEGYYGVVASFEGAVGSLQLSPFYTSRSDAIKAIQNIPGARFKKFKSQASAEAFSNSPGGNSGSAGKGATRDVVQHAPGVGDKPNQFPSLKTQHLSKFRKLIESGDVLGFSQAVWSNPRYLINCYGDAPEILQPGCRYNALHCAVRARKLEICKELMAILQDHHFWDLVYPNDSDDTVLDRKKHLIDLYLNMQDKIGGETPLHFACKLGYEEIVSFLLSFPSIDTSIKNKPTPPSDTGKTAAEIVCANAKSSSSTLKDRITDLINAPPVYYVPVFRAVDNCTPPQLTPPCTMEEYNQQESVLSDEMGTPIIGQAFAGPMSPAQAEDFYREWRSPSHSRERQEAHRIKRSDANRGFERVGRQLAQQRDVGWLEFWDFLGCYCNLRKPEGVAKLEHYLASLSSPPRRSPKLARQVAVTSKDYTPHSGTRKGRKGNGDLSRELFPKDGGGKGEEEEEEEEEEEIEAEEEGEQREGEEEKEREEDFSEPPVTDLDSVIESMACMTLGDMREAEENGVIVGEGEEERRGEGGEKEEGGEEMEVEEEGREGDRGGGEMEEEDGVISMGHTHTKVVEPPTVDQQNDYKGLDLPATEGHSETISQDSWLLEDGEKGALSGGNGPATPPRPGARAEAADKRTLGFLLGPEPTKLDRDVVLALGDVPDLPPSQYPHTLHWLERVKAFSEQEQRSWRTPLSSWEQHCRREKGETPSRRLSPLVISSPSLSPLHRPPIIPSSSSSPHRLFPNALSPRHNFSPLHRSQNASTPSHLKHTARAAQVLQNVTDISFPV